MSSKEVLDAGKSADALIEAANTHAPEIARRRAAQYAAAKLKGAATAAAIEAQLRLDASLLAFTLAALRRTDAALAAELGDDPEVFATRESAAATVRASLVEFRDVVATNCGSAAVAKLGYVGETPRDPAALETLGRAVCKAAADAPPRSQKRGVRFDANAALEGVVQEVDALADANKAVLREKREEQSERAKRNEAWATFERERAAFGRSLDAQLRAVGLDELADRLVPSTGASATGAAEAAPPTETPAAPTKG